MIGQNDVQDAMQSKHKVYWNRKKFSLEDYARQSTNINLISSLLQPGKYTGKGLRFEDALETVVGEVYSTLAKLGKAPKGKVDECIFNRVKSRLEEILSRVVPPEGRGIKYIPGEDIDKLIETYFATQLEYFAQLIKERGFKGYDVAIHRTGLLLSYINSLDGYRAFKNSEPERTIAAHREQQTALSATSSP